MPGKNYRNLRTDRVRARNIENRPQYSAPLKPGQVRCPTCMKPTTLRMDGSIRVHIDPSTGTECVEGSKPRKQDHEPVDNDMRTASPNGRCHQCGKPVTGERKLCGQCMAKRR